MKKLTLFLFTLLISCSVLGALPKKTVLYLNASSWGYGDAEFIAYFCNGTSGTKWLKMDKVENGYYKCTTPDGDYKDVLFLRVNPTHTNVKDKTTGTSWPGDAVWNQTNNLTFTEANNIYVKTGWGNSEGWWSTILEPNTEIYFAKTDTDWVNSSASLLIGHDTYSEAYSLTNIEGTNLFYKKITNKWEGYKEWIVINEKWDGGEGKIISERTKNVSKKIDVNKNLLALCHLINGSSNEKISSYSSLNYSQTINSGANGTVTAESYKLTSANGTTKQEATAQASSKTTLSAALTATLTLTPTANTGYHFDKWNDNNTENPRTVTIKSNATYTATFAINTYTVSVSANNAEWGTVSDSGVVEYDSSVELSAEPKEGYNFDGWYENSTLISSDPNYTYSNITEDKEIVAQFSPKSFRITIEDSKQGQLVDYNTRENIFTDYYDYGTVLNIEAVPDNGYEFVEWEDGSSENPRTFTVTGEATISATYKAKTYTVTLSADPAEGGYVDGAGTYEYDSYINIYATPNEGYRFVRWSDGDENQSRDFWVEKDIELTAHFELIKYNVDIYAQDGGSVVGADEKEYPYGTQLTFEAVPAPGYEFIKWSDDNTDNPRTIIVEEDINSLYPIFELKDVVFTNETDLEFATYGHLTYQLTMDENRWYWISLPFDVNVEDITTSTGGSWNDLVFTEYDAQRRADGGNGWINWKTAGKDIAAQTLIANKGYVIGPKDAPFNQDGDFIVYFPSANSTNDVVSTTYLSTEPTQGDKQQDANWHIIGTGLYHPTTKLGNINYIAIPDNVGDYKYYYVGEASGFFQTELNHTFKPFEAFFVQYGGDYSATADLTKSAAELAPMARAKAQEQEQIYLINMNEARTVVILNAEGSEGYTAGEDFLEMNLGSRIEMIYSFDGTDALAFNHRAPEAQSIALGGYVATAGEQTISLNAYNGNAEAVTLIDNFTGETADLLTDNYTFTAEVGSLDGRFTIVFAAQKAGGVTTDCYNSVANQVIAYGTADHCTVSGLTAGKAIAIYNTMGQLVFATIANSETITLPSLTAGNYLILHNGTTNKVALR